jgi:two-component system cell cycle response regulator
VIAPQILVVEDEAIVAADISNTLQGLGYAVPAVASSGEAAIELATAKRPDLVLMDIRLKGSMDGVKAARTISDRLGIPVVYLTAHADERTLRRAKTTQPFGYVLKPFDERGLHVAIEMALDRSRTHETLQRLATVDDLAGVYNRRGFLSLANQHLKLARRTRTGFWLILLDIDRLKQINDTFGHTEGDRAIVVTAEILRKTFRESDIIARLGGDEFSVVTIQAADDSVQSMIARLRENLDHCNATRRVPYELALSVGLAHFDPAKPVSLEELVASADDALYEDKRGKP